MNGITIIVIVAALWLACAIFCLVKRWLFIRSHKVCPNCGHKMNVLWIDEDIDPRDEMVHAGGMYVIAGKVTKYTSLLRCSHCGYEIPLGKNQ